MKKSEKKDQEQKTKKEKVGTETPPPSKPASLADLLKQRFPQGTTERTIEDIFLEELSKHD